MNRLNLSPRRARGFSLVELVVALAIGMIVVLVVGSFFASTRRSYTQADASSRMQENGRSGMHMLSTDIRMAGFMGCRNEVPVNNIAQPDNNFFDYTSAIRGYVQGVGTLPAGLPSWDEVKAGTSLVAIQRGESISARLSGNLNPNNAQIQIKGNPAGVQDDEILMISDCTQADVFRVNNVSHNGQTVAPSITVTINHSAATNTQPHLSKAYLSDSEIMRLVSRLYYVGSGKGSCPLDTLCRLNLAVSGSAPTVQVESLISNIEDLDLLYGIDADADRGADRYVAAGDVTAWTNVVSVQVNFLLHSEHDKVTTGKSPVWYNGATYTPSNADDRYMRRSFSQVVTLRNRTL